MKLLRSNSIKEHRTLPIALITIWSHIVAVAFHTNSSWLNQTTFEPGKAFPLVLNLILTARQAFALTAKLLTAWEIFIAEPTQVYGGKCDAPCWWDGCYGFDVAFWRRLKHYIVVIASVISIHNFSIGEVGWIFILCLKQNFGHGFELLLRRIARVYQVLKAKTLRNKIVFSWANDQTFAKPCTLTNHILNGWFSIVVECPKMSSIWFCIKWNLVAFHIHIAEEGNNFCVLAVLGIWVEDSITEIHEGCPCKSDSWAWLFEIDGCLFERIISVEEPEDLVIVSNIFLN